MHHKARQERLCARWFSRSTCPFISLSPLSSLFAPTLPLKLPTYKLYNSSCLIKPLKHFGIHPHHRLITIKAFLTFLSAPRPTSIFGFKPLKYNLLHLLRSLFDKWKPAFIIQIFHFQSKLIMTKQFLPSAVVMMEDPLKLKHSWQAESALLPSVDTRLLSRQIIFFISNHQSHWKPSIYHWELRVT